MDKKEAQRRIKASRQEMKADLRRDGKTLRREERDLKAFNRRNRGR